MLFDVEGFTQLLTSSREEKNIVSRMHAFSRSVLLALVIFGAQVGAARSAPSPLAPAPLLAGVATDHAGHVYVADTSKGRIYVLSQNLRLLAVWTIPRPGGPSDVHLVGVAIDGNGAIYTTDLDGRIFTLTSPGNAARDMGFARDRGRPVPGAMGDRCWVEGQRSCGR